MYTLMIVDDERVICMGIQHRISMLNNPDIDQIHIAFNGKEALELAKEIKPDIIITDIRMPEMGGIELIKVLSENDSHIKFIVLSGYDDYDYIRSAFKLGALDYLLKPATTSELEYHLNSAIKKIKEESAIKEEYKAKLTSVDKHKSDIKLKLSQIFFNPYPFEHEVEEQFIEFKDSFPFTCFAVGVVIFDNSNIQDFKPINDQLEDLKLRIFSGFAIQLLWIDKNMEYLMFVFNFSKAEVLGPIVAFLEDFVKNLTDITHLPSAASISTVGSGIENLKKLYYEAQEAIKYRIVFDPGQVIAYNQIPPSDQEFMMSKSEFNEIENLIGSQSFKQICIVIDKWLKREVLAGQSIVNIKLLYDILLKNLNNLMDSQQYIVINEKSKNFYQFNTLDELKTYLKEYVYKINQLISQQQKNEKTIMDIAKKYVDENFRKEINMAEISNMLSLNYSYFSKLFKDQIGMTFTAYLTKLRMDEAKKLLSDPTNRITEISAKLGYDNIHNFSRAFKNYFGISPKQYRN